jgi:DNA-binding transcriptional regulator PaaX
MSKVKQTQIGKVEAMLRRPSGASLAAICKTTGWQPHSARAALSGLRKAGCVVERTPSEGKARASIYRITGTGEAVA